MYTIKSMHAQNKESISISKNVCNATNALQCQPTPYYRDPIVGVHFNLEIAFKHPVNASNLNTQLAIIMHETTAKHNTVFGPNCIRCNACNVAVSGQQGLLLIPAPNAMLTKNQYEHSLNLLAHTKLQTPSCIPQQLQHNLPDRHREVRVLLFISHALKTIVTYVRVYKRVGFPAFCWRSAKLTVSILRGTELAGVLTLLTITQPSRIRLKQVETFVYLEMVDLTS